MNLICGSGFLGAELKAKSDFIVLDPKEHKMLRYAHKLGKNEQNHLVELLRGLDLDVFINASGPSSVEESFEKPELYISDQLAQIEAHLEILSRLDKLPRYIYFSSAAVYGETESSPISESHELDPISPYGIGKQRVEESLKSEAFRRNFQVIVLRVFSAYSNNLNSRLPMLIAKKLLAGKNFELYGSGQECRDFIHTDDVVRMINLLLACQDLEQFSVLNLGSGQRLSVSDVCDIAQSVYTDLTTSADKTITFSNVKRIGDPDYLIADITKLKDLGAAPLINPEAGLREYFKWKIKELQE
jgi:UDP-glucose 4-epimerase